MPHRTPATRLTLEYLRCRGVLVDIAERLIPRPARETQALPPREWLRQQLEFEQMPSGEDELGALLEKFTSSIAGERAPFPVKHDLFNAFDVVGIGPDGRVYFVQTTGAQGAWRSRLSKMRNEPAIIDVISRIALSNARIEVHGWQKVERNYQVRVALVTVKDGRFEWDDATDVPTLAQARAQARANAKHLPLFDEVAVAGDDEEDIW